MGLVDEVYGTGQPSGGGLVDEVYGNATTPTQQAQKPTGKTVGGFISNIGSDAWNTAKGIADIFYHFSPPGQLAHGITNMVKGQSPNPMDQDNPLMGAINLMKGAGQSVLGSYMPNQFPEYAQMNTPAIQQFMNLYAPIGESFINPSGIPQRVVDYAYEKPVSTALNVSAGAGILGKAAEGANLARTGNILGTVSDFTNPINAVTSPVAKMNNSLRGIKPVEQAIDYGIAKGIRPSVESQRSFGKMNSYQEKAREAVKTIVDNKANLQLTDEFGELTNKLPENLREFSQAVDQTKKVIFDQYNQKAKATGMQGATVNLSPTATELTTLSKNKVLSDMSPSTAKYAQERAAMLANRGTYTVEEAQEALKVLNQSLEVFYKNPTLESASKAYVDSLIANKMRKGLDDIITNATGPGYQELKNQYGALKTIEKDVNRRAIVDARKNAKSLIDFADVFSGSEVIRGMLSLNPATMGAGAAAKGISRLIKHHNDPNVVIKKMFRNVENPNPTNGTKMGMGGNILYQTSNITSSE